MKRSTYLAAIAALTILAVVRVASTHRVFNATLDEPTHLVAGWQWIAGNDQIDYSHPPLARALAALPLRFLELPDPPRDMGASNAGNYLLYYGDRYLKHLARARLGNLLLMMVAIAAVAAHANRAFGRGVSVLATALFTNLPPVLGHAGLVTTDMAITAAIPLALFALDLYLERATWKRAVFLGAAIGFGVLGKFSFLLFFAVTAIVLIVVRRKAAALLPHSRALLVAITAFVVIWGGYRFDVSPIGDYFYGAAFFAEHAVPKSMQTEARWFADHVPIPAPGLAAGLAMLLYHDSGGHLAFLLGEKSETGWWYYFPVVFFFKTPLPFLLLAAIGIVLMIRRRAAIEHVLIPLAILLVAMTGSINIGVRHILPVYGSLAIVAAYATFTLRRRMITWALLGWLIFGVAAAHPDYLAYFNEAAGKNPARIAVDSNLDWGQDLLRLERLARELQMQKVWVLYSTIALYEHHAIPADRLPDFQPVSGWVAVGETPMALWGDRFAWLEAYEPVRRVGKSMRLYYVP